MATPVKQTKSLGQKKRTAMKISKGLVKYNMTKKTKDERRSS